MQSHVEKHSREYRLYATFTEIASAAEILLNRLSSNDVPDHLRFVGYDSEFTSMRRGSTTHTRLSLIQLATHAEAYLFHVHNLETLPQSLISLLTNRMIVKIGFGTQQDTMLLHQTYGISLHVLDLQLIISLMGGNRWGLDDATKHFCNYELEPLDGRDGTAWQTVNEEKQRYAAMDAFACVDIWSRLSPILCQQSPPPLVLPKPRFGVDDDEAEHAMAWLRKLPQASTKEAMINQFINSYAPWAKLDTITRRNLAIKVVDKIMALKNSNSTNNGTTNIPKMLPTNTTQQCTIPSYTISQLNHPSTNHSNHNTPNGLPKAEIDRATVLLRQTHPQHAIRKRDRIVNQLLNSIGALKCEPCTVDDKRNYIEAIIETMLVNGKLVRRNEVEIELVL